MQKRRKTKMTLWKSIVVLLALLLAAMAVMPVTSATESSPAITTENTSAANGQTSIVASRVTGSEFKIKNVDMSEEDFRKANAELIEFLSKSFNKTVVDKMIDNEYDKTYGKFSKTASFAKGINDIVQIGGYNIYLWPYSNTATSTGSYSGSINLFFYGMTKSQVTSYMKNTASTTYSDALGFTEYGYRGSSSGSLSWTTTSSYDQLQNGDYYTTRYHLVLFEGGYSSSLGKNWCYGQTHYEYWSWLNPGPGHYLGGNAFDMARTFFNQAMNGAKPWSNMYIYSDDPGYADGYAYTYWMS
jgi:hypothetical protein